MEVEFLSNVRYNLFVSKAEWTQWHSKLGRFADFFEKASRMPPENEFAPTTPVHQISPTDASRRYNLPVSPASKLPSPPSTNPLQPQTQLQSQITRPTWNQATTTAAPYRLNTSPRALPNFEFPPYSRKRSWEDDVEENPSKRMAVSNYSAAMPAMPVSATSMPSATSMSSVPVLPPVLANMPLSVPSLAIPVPRLSQPTTYQPVSTALIPPTLPAATMPQQLPLPHVRAMSTVFNPSSTWSQAIPSATVAPVVPTVQTSNPMALYNPITVSLPDPSRRQSPYSATISSDAVSPSAFHVHTPQNHLSPSFFLVNRNSPYRPVRAVNTLLIPPPSASLHQPRLLSMDQMHYQPLGKSFTERRTGVLPYLHHDGLPQGVIPQQPNFLPSQY